MDMVNDGKDTRLDTPQAVKEALASGKDLYNPETGEFWWKYNDTGSIANTYIYLDDPNLLAVIGRKRWTGIGNHQYPQAQFTCNIP